jgi:hypothetical protein
MASRMVALKATVLVYLTGGSTAAQRDVTMAYTTAAQRGATTAYLKGGSMVARLVGKMAYRLVYLKVWTTAGKDT